MPGSARSVGVPIGRRLQVFCQTALPVLVFLGAGAGVFYLLQNQAGSSGFTGEAFALTADAAAPGAGRLMPLNSPEVLNFVQFPQTQAAQNPAYQSFLNHNPTVEVQEFTRVKKGDVIGILDPAPLMRQYAVLRAQFAQIQASVASTSAEAVFADEEARDRRYGDTMQMVEALARMQIQLAEAQGLKLSAEVAFFAAKDEHDRLVKIYKTNPEAAQVWQITQAKNLRDLAAQNWRGYRDTVDRITGEIEMQKKRLGQQPEIPVGKIKALLEPVYKELAAQEEMVKQLTATFDTLLVTAPIDGIVSIVLKRTGQTVASAEPIVTISSEKSPFILGYIRLNQTTRPEGGWLNKQVEVVVPSDPRNTIRGYIQHVGAQVVQVPIKLQRDPRYPEWGLPVAIALPPSELKGRQGPVPGELVQVMVPGNEWTGEKVPETKYADVMRASTVTASRSTP